MLLKKMQKGTAQRLEEVKGTYTSKEKRMEQRNEIARAHFNFGQEGESNLVGLLDLEMPAKSFSQDHFQELQADSAGFGSKLAEKIRQSNFYIGQNNQFFPQTTAADSFKTLGGAQAHLNRDVLNDLRKEHFKFGSTGT